MQTCMSAQQACCWSFGTHVQLFVMLVRGAGEDVGMLLRQSAERGDRLFAVWSAVWKTMVQKHNKIPVNTVQYPRAAQFCAQPFLQQLAVLAWARTFQLAGPAPRHVHQFKRTTKSTSAACPSAQS